MQHFTTFFSFDTSKPSLLKTVRLFQILQTAVTVLRLRLRYYTILVLRLHRYLCDNNPHTRELRVASDPEVLAMM